jgi:hypothetical protein
MEGVGYAGFGGEVQLDFVAGRARAILSQRRALNVEMLQCRSMGQVNVEGSLTLPLTHSRVYRHPAKYR